MKNHVASAIFPLAVLLLLPGLAVAQQEPVTGQMMDGRQAVVAAPVPVPPPQDVAPPVAPPSSTAAATAPLKNSYATAPAAARQVAAPPVIAGQAELSSAPPLPPASAPSSFYAAQVGDTTRHLLQIQAEGSQAGKPLPMLGAEASASYARYLKSFNHDIPEFYETTIGKDGGGQSGGGL